MSTVIHLRASPTPTSAKSQRRQIVRHRPKTVTKEVATRARLAALRKESVRASASHCVAKSSTLRMLSYLAKVASPRAKSVKWDGIRFPLRQGFSLNTVLCPETGMPLVSAVAI